MLFISGFCYKNIGGKRSLFISLIYIVGDYDRYYVLTITALLLAMKELIDKPNNWLQVWVLGTFLSGLYYPLSGVAMLVGGLPFGIVQMTTLIRNDNLYTQFRKPMFYVGWIFCLIPIILCIPLLIRISQHMLIYASQSVLYDKLMIFGQGPLDNFLTIFKKSHSLRTAIWYGFKFALEISGILLCIAVIGVFLSHKSKSLKEKLFSAEFYYFSVSIGILLVLYTYTILRQDENCVMARSSFPVLIFTCLMLGIAIWKYGAQYYTRNCRNAMLGIITTIYILICGFPQFKNLNTPCKISEDYQIIDAKLIEEFPNVGRGFIHKKTNEKLLFYKDLYANDKIRQYLILCPDQLIFHVLTLKASTFGSHYVAAGQASQKEAYDIMMASPPIIQTHPDSVNYYYLYRQLITAGYQKTPNGMFMKPEHMQEIYGSTAVGASIEETMYCKIDWKTKPGAWGNSIESLSKKFKDTYLINWRAKVDIGTKQIDEKRIKLTKELLNNTTKNTDSWVKIQLEDLFPGKKADFLWLKIRLIPARLIKHKWLLCKTSG